MCRGEIFEVRSLGKNPRIKGSAVILELPKFPYNREKEGSSRDKYHLDLFSRFNRTPTCETDTHTQTQTDRQTQGHSR